MSSSPPVAALGIIGQVATHLSPLNRGQANYTSKVLALLIFFEELIHGRELMMQIRDLLACEV
jgi:hypothetical protein